MTGLSSFVCALAAFAKLAGAIDFQVASTGGAPVSPLQYGFFFEDINHSGDGGIYAELIQNRAFQANSSETATLFPWYAESGANLQLVTNDASPLSSALPFSVSVSGGSGSVGISNPGWFGFDVKPQTYVGSFWAKGDYTGKFTASLHSNLTSDTFASTDIQVTSAASDGWKNYNFTLNPPVAAPNSNNTFTLTFDSAGAQGPLQFNLISLFPPTYNNRPNGMRVDLMEQLVDLSLSYLRFPGGNNLEGDSNTTNHWRWNETIGPLTERPGRDGVWGYYNTDGLGLDEYFQWTEDLDAEPILAIWDGFYLLGPALSQGDTDFYVQDALNELEYILGNESTPYGGLRCTNGHPEPYKLRYVEIGNEDNLGDGLTTYAAYRFNLFYNAIHAAYPDIVLISSTTELTQEQLPPGTAADYHQYTRPDYFVNQSNFWDANTTAHQTLIGEFATVQVNIPPFDNGTLQPVNFSDPRAGYPFWIGSVAEAVFLLGAERNAEKILGSSYAPGFQNLDSYAWAPDLIQFAADPAITTQSTSYQMLNLLSNTRFTQTRPANVTDQPGHPGPAASSSDGPVYWAAGTNTLTGSEILKLAVYNSSGNASLTNPVPQQNNPGGNNAPEFTDIAPLVDVTVTFEGAPAGQEARLTVLEPQGGNANATDFPRQPDPLTKWSLVIQADQNGQFAFSVPDLSLAVLETKGSQGNGYDGQWGFGGYGGCKNGAARASYDWGSWLASGNEGTGC